jgi:hypothetical protein
VAPNLNIADAVQMREACEVRLTWTSCRPSGAYASHANSSKEDVLNVPMLTPLLSVTEIRPSGLRSTQLRLEQMLKLADERCVTPETLSPP